MLELVDTNTIFGIGKRMSQELEKLPLQSHCAIFNMLQTAMQHRQINEQALLEEQAKTERDRQQQLANDERARQTKAAADRFAKQIAVPTAEHVNQPIDLVSK